MPEAVWQCSCHSYQLWSSQEIVFCTIVGTWVHDCGDMSIWLWGYECMIVRTWVYDCGDMSMWLWGHEYMIVRTWVCDCGDMSMWLWGHEYVIVGTQSGYIGCCEEICGSGIYVWLWDMRIWLCGHELICCRFLWRNNVVQGCIRVRLWNHKCMSLFRLLFMLMLWYIKAIQIYSFHPCARYSRQFTRATTIRPELILI